MSRGGALLTLRAAAGDLARDGLGRTLLALAGIALGVALGCAVHLVNHSAKNEVSLAMHGLAGTADLVVQGPRSGFTEDVYPRLALLPAVESASPAIETAVRVPGRSEPLRLLGLDPLRALRVQPALLGEAPDLAGLLRGDTVLLSDAAARWLGLAPGDTLTVQTGRGEQPLRVGAILPVESYAQRIAVMDIAAVQWDFDRVGALTRIDLRLRPGTDVSGFTQAIRSLLPAGVHAMTPDAQAGQGEQITRAYRVNLDMLALVALFTGGFLVFSTQALALVRRRTQLAVLRALGMRRWELLRLLLARSALTGACGAGLGVALGTAAGVLALRHIGSDLGAGHFSDLAVRPHIEPWTLLAFFLLGVATAVLGTFAPALQAVRTAPAAALKPGDHASARTDAHRPWTALALFAAAAALSQLPSVDGLPLFGYTAVAMLLFGGLACMPWLVQTLSGALPRMHSPTALLAFGRLRGSPTHVTLSLAGILASFSLMAAMLIMVTSFRGSLERWLHDILPADVYVRAGGADRVPRLDDAAQRAVATAPGVDEARFVRYEAIVLDPARPPLTLIARDLRRDAAMPDALPLVAEAARDAHPDLPRAWITEAVRDLHRLEPGDRVTLPLRGRPVEFAVAGVWRDYARQGGAILVDRRLFVALTGETAASDAWVWGRAGVSTDVLTATLRERLAAAGDLELRVPAELRAVSLRTFDRTFAITYALEAVAVVIGLFGISAAFGADAVARRSEHGMLRHIGLRRRDVLRTLALEGTLVGTVGVAAGLALGWLISLVLVHVVNRQSFHWSLDMHVPVLSLAVIASVLVIAAAVTAAASARSAMGRDVLRAVREDW